MKHGDEYGFVLACDPPIFVNRTCLGGVIQETRKQEIKGSSRMGKKKYRRETKILPREKA